MQESDQHYDVRVSGSSGPDHSLAFPTREQAEWVAAGIRVQTPGACVTVVGCDSEDCDTPAWPPAGARLGRAGVNRRAPASVKTPRIRPRRGLLNASGRSRGSRASCLVDKASLSSTLVPGRREEAGPCYSGADWSLSCGNGSETTDAEKAAGDADRAATPAALMGLLAADPTGGWTLVLRSVSPIESLLAPILPGNHYCLGR